MKAPNTLKERSSLSASVSSNSSPNKGNATKPLFTDNSSHSSAQRKLKGVIEKGTNQRRLNTSNTEVAQRLVGATGSVQEGKKVPFTLSPDFITKHVANNAAEAESVTEARILTGSPAGMVAGTAPNNLAKQADWETAVENSLTVVPDKDKWGSDLSYWSDDNEFAPRILFVSVPGWEAIGKTGHVNVSTSDNKKYLGGYWDVSGSKEETNGDYVNKSASISVEIDHLTS